MVNACVARESTPERLTAVYTIEQMWYHGKHPQSFSAHQKMISDHRGYLDTFRSNTSNNLSELDASNGDIETDDIFSETNMNASLDFVARVFEMSAKCSNDFVTLAKSIIESSIGLLGEPPCSFAVIGLGSIARGEATPFSDLEYAFIVEHDDPYFTKLAVDSYFRITNLGESPLKCFNVQEFHHTDSEGKRRPYFIDQPPVNGFKIDGISPKAGNIPTGHGLPGGKRLILTVDELMDFYSRSLNAAPDPNAPGDMADLLSSSVVILSHKNGEALHNQFIERRKDYESEVVANCVAARNKRLETIKSDIENHNFLPEFEFGGVKHTMIQVKTDIFRYPTLLATNLRIILQLDAKYPWQVFESLLDSGLLSSHNHKCMRIALGLSIFIRTNAYTKLGSQQELLSLYSKVDMPIQQDDRYYIPRNLFAVLGCLLIPIKLSLSKSLLRASITLENHDSLHLYEFMKEVVRRFEVSHTDFILKAEVLHFMGDAKAGLKVITDAAGGSDVLEDGEKFIELVRAEYNTVKSDKLEKKALMLCASLLSFNYKKLLHFCTWLITYSQSAFEIAHWQRNAADCLVNLQEYAGVVSILNQVLASLRSAYSLDGNVSIVDYVIQMIQRSNRDPDSHPHNMGKFIVNVYSLFGRAKVGLHGKEATRKDGQTAEALKDFGQCVKILNILKGKGMDVRRDLAFVYDHMAKCYREDGDQIEALTVNLKFLELSQSLYGMNAVHKDFVQFYVNIGNIGSKIGEGELANLYVNHAVDLNNQTVDQEGTRAYRLSKPIRDVEHLSDTYHLIAVVHHKKGQFSEALKYHHQALVIREKRRGQDGREHPSVAMSHTYIANLSLDIGKLQKALRHHQLALELLKRIHGADTDSTDIASCHQDVGSVYREMGNYGESMDQLMKALVMRDKLTATAEKKKPPQELQPLLHSIGKLLTVQGSFVKASSYYAASLTMSISSNVKAHSSLLVELAELMASKHEYKYAVQFAKLALSKAKSGNNQSDSLIVAHAYHLIGRCFMMVPDLNRYRSQSYKFLNSSLDILRASPTSRPVRLLAAKAHHSLAKLYFELKQFSSSKQFVERSLGNCSDIITMSDVTGPECLNIRQDALSLRDSVVAILTATQALS